MPTWMYRSKESEAARQAAARERRQSRGDCIRCGLACDPNSVQLCPKHLLAQRQAARERSRKKHLVLASKEGRRSA